MKFMAPEAICAKCGGTGFVIVEGVNVSGAKPCDCRALRRVERLEDRSQIPPLYRSDSFDNFEIPGPENPTARRDLTTVLLAVKGFVRAFPNVERPGLLLIGDPGIGKTHLAVAAAHEIIKKGFELWFCSYQELLKRIKDGYDPISSTSDREAYRKALDSEVLLIDDLAANKTSDWVQDTINSIITHRCDHRKPLIATTNAPDPVAGSERFEKNALGRTDHRRTLEDYVGIRARSRLFEMCTVVKMPLIADYRLGKRKEF
jgi:DNA replication protein DnaC